MSAVLRKKPKLADVIKDKRWPIVHDVNYKVTSLSKMIFKELPMLELSHVIVTDYYHNALWHSPLFTMPAVLRKKCRKLQMSQKDKGGPIMHSINYEVTSLSKIIFKVLPTLKLSHIIPTVYYVNVHCHSYHLVLQNICLNWSGFM